MKIGLSKFPRASGPSGFIASMVNVGIKAVQEVQAAIAHYGASEAWVVITDAAYRLAKSNAVRLVNREPLIEWLLAMKSGSAIPKPATDMNTTTVNQRSDHDSICSRCGGEMVKHKSSKGAVYACFNFPNCQNVEYI